MKPQTLRVGAAVWIARHGNRADFADPTWSERAKRPHDPGLSPDGVQQARELGRRLAGQDIRHIFASPFLRTVQTAVEVAEALGLSVKIEHGACEWLNPEWFPQEPELLDTSEMARLFPRVDPTYQSRIPYRYPEYDEQDDCWSRAGLTARLLAQEFAEDMLIIGHGASMMGLVHGLTGDNEGLDCGLCCFAKVVWNGSLWKVVLNDSVSRPDAAAPRT